MSFWQPMASSVTMLFFRASRSSSSGMAVISFDVSSTQRWPSTRSCSLAQALTRCSGACSCLRSNERRSVLPSMATTSRSKPATSEPAQAEKPASNASGSISIKHAPEGVVRGDAIRQLQKAPKPGQLAAAVEGDVVPTLGTGDHGADRDHQDVGQAMLDLAAAAWIHDRPEMPNQPLDGHALLPHLRRRRSSLDRQLTSERDFMRSPWAS